MGCSCNPPGTNSSARRQGSLPKGAPPVSPKQTDLSRPQGHTSALKESRPHGGAAQFAPDSDERARAGESVAVPRGLWNEVAAAGPIEFPDRNLEGLYPEFLISGRQRLAPPPASPPGHPAEPRLRPAANPPADVPRTEGVPRMPGPPRTPGMPRTEPGAVAQTRSGQGGVATGPDEPRPGPLGRLVSKITKPLANPSRFGSPEFSIIIPNKDEGDLLVRTVHSVVASKGPSFEVIVVDDRSRRPPDLNGRWPNVVQIDGPGLGVAPARNLGAERARGRYLVFLDGHVSVPPDWLVHIERVFQAYPQLAAVSPGIAVEGDVDMVGFGLTWDERLQIHWLAQPADELAEVPLLPGGCVAVRREVFETSGGFNRGFRGHGYDDQEFSLRLWLLGYHLACLRDVVVVHRFRTEFPYPVEPWQHYYNLLRMAVSHFNEARIGKVLAMVQQAVDPSLLLARILTDDTMDDRRRWLEIRAHDDDWFMSRFGIPF